MEFLEKAKRIALKDLRSCYSGEGILASRVNYSDFWARDTFWASLGLLKIGEDLEKVKQSLELFLKYQRVVDGKIPRKIALDYNLFKYLGVEIKRDEPRPIYTSSLKWRFSMDDNLLFVIAFCEYVKRSGDAGFAKEHCFQAKKALEFYSERALLEDGLISEAGFSNWEDTIYKKGLVLYTNCLWYEAVRRFEQLRDCSITTPSFQESERLLIKIRNTFLAGVSSSHAGMLKEDAGYFVDSVHGNKKEYFFDLAGNVLAVLFGIADDRQAEKILGFAERLCNKFPQKDKENVLHPINYPHYPWYKISPAARLFGISDYQNGISWSWIEALLAAAHVKVGSVEKGRVVLENLAKIVIDNGHVHETYYLDGRPFDHFLWKSAVPFAWGAGLFLYALDRLEKKDG